MGAPHTFLLHIYRHHALGVSVRERLSFVPRRWFRGNLHSGARGCEEDMCVPALGQTWRLRAAPHLFPRGRPGTSRQRPGHSRSAAQDRAEGEDGARTHHALLRLDEGPAEAVHLAVEAAGVAQIVAGAVPPPERRLDGAAVHAFTALGQVLQQVCGDRGDRRRPGEDAPLPPLPGRPPAPLAPGLATCCPPPRRRPSPRLPLLSSQVRSRPWSLSSVCPILLQPWGAPSETPGKSWRWCCRPSPSHLPSVSKDS